MRSTDVNSKLYLKYNVHAVSVAFNNIRGLRITPNVYTSLADLDKFIDSVKK